MCDVDLHMDLDVVVSCCRFDAAFSTSPECLEALLAYDSCSSSSSSTSICDSSEDDPSPAAVSAGSKKRKMASQKEASPVAPPRNNPLDQMVANGSNR